MAGFRKAERRQMRLRIGLAGPSGSGKTVSSLLVAYGITGDWNAIGLVDTEHNSGDIPVGSTVNGVTIGEYNILPLEPPYTPDVYIEAIKEAEKAGIKVLILDSISHAWAGEGGLLEKHGQLAKRGGNSFDAWRDVTPLHNKFVEAMLSCNLHLIATLRAKVEYAVEKSDRGTTIKKMGMAPIQRDGMEYEFTVFLDLDQSHQASSSKDRTSLFDGKIFTPSPKTGEMLRAWAESGVEAPAQQARPTAAAQPAKAPDAKALRSEVIALVKRLNLADAMAKLTKDAFGVTVKTADMSAEQLQTILTILQKQEPPREEAAATEQPAPTTLVDGGR